MSGKRNDMVDDAYGNLMMDCPGKRRVLARWAQPDIRLWLTVHALRYARAATGYQVATEAGVSGDSAKMQVYCTTAVGVINHLIEMLGDRFSMHDVHEALDILGDNLNPPRVVDTAADGTVLRIREKRG